MEIVVSNPARNRKEEYKTWVIRWVHFSYIFLYSFISSSTSSSFSTSTFSISHEKVLEKRLIKKPEEIKRRKYNMVERLSWVLSLVSLNSLEEKGESESFIFKWYLVYNMAEWSKKGLKAAVSC